MNYSSNYAPWWQKAVGVATLGIVAQVIKHEIGLSYRGRKPHPCIDEELDELDERLYQLETACVVPAADDECVLDYVPVEETLNDINEQDIEPVIDIVNGLVVLGGVCIVFGLPGHGKSTMLMQMLIDIAFGQDSKIWPGCTYLDSNVKVTLYDAELHKAQIKKRYCEHGFRFPTNLVRIKDSKVVSKGSAVIADIKRVVASSSKHQVIAIDNMTKIFENMSAPEISSFYKQLDQIHESAEKRGQIVTIFVVGHTTKADPYSAPELSDLYGSSFLGNFANTVLAFWPSCYGNDTKFVRVLKNRDHEYSDSEVTLMKRVSEPYHQFELVKTNVPLEEALMVKPKGKRTKDDDAEESTKPGPKPQGYTITDSDLDKMLGWAKEGWAQAKMAEELGVHPMAVSRAIKDWKKNGLWKNEE